jgi:branched-subunit amino acid ABC-type transport system permease component
LAVVLLVVAPLIGALLYLAIIRGLEGTDEIVKLVVPISVLLAFIGIANWVWKPDVPHTIPPFFGSSNSVEIFGVIVLWHDLTILFVAIALAVGLRLLLYRTRTGVAMRAVVDDRSLVELNGAEPDVVSLFSWMLGVSLSALAGILITPFQGGSLSATLLTLLVINAFAAAMFGRLRNLPLTFVGAVVLGFLTRMAFERPTGFMPKSFDWRGNLRLAVPMILLFVVLLVLPQDRLRGAVVTRTRERFTLPTMGDALFGAATLLVAIFLLSRIMAPAPLITLSNGVASAVIMLSLVLLVGYAGEVSLATMAFAGIGGTIFFHHVGHAPTDRAGFGAYLVAMFGTALVGGLIALPALRLRGLYLGLATAAFSVGVEQMVFKEFAISRRIYPATLLAIIALTLVAAYFAYRSRRVVGLALALGVGGVVFALAATSGWLQDETWSPIFPNGNLQLPRPELFGIDFRPQTNFLMLLTVVFASLGVGLVGLRRSSYGRRLTAMKNSPAACATLGMNLVRLKLSVFMLASAIAALGGCLYGQQLGAVTGERFSLFESMAMFMLIVVAGMGYVSGGFTAGLLYSAAFVALQNTLTKLGDDYDAFGGGFAWLASFTAVMPALIGIGLGKNPSGFLNDIFVAWGPMIRKVRPVFWAGVAVEIGVWFCAWRDWIGNWTFTILTIAWMVLLPRVAMAVRPAAFTSADVREARHSATPPEQIGVDRPFEPEDLRTIDQVLGIHRAVT